MARLGTRARTPTTQPSPACPPAASPSVCVLLPLELVYRALRCRPGHRLNRPDVLSLFRPPPRATPRAGSTRSLQHLACLVRAMTFLRHIEDTAPFWSISSVSSMTRSARPTAPNPAAGRIAAAVLRRAVAPPRDPTRRVGRPALRCRSWNPHQVADLSRNP